MRFRSEGRVPAVVVSAVPTRVLAAARAGEQWAVGTRSALFLVDGDGMVTLQLPWEQVQAAEWESEQDRLVVTEVGSFGSRRDRHMLVLTDPGRLLELVRERVTASVVLQRRVPVHDRRGLSVVARRSPVGGRLRWMVEYDEGVDPEDPEVSAIADEALARARAEVGETTSDILEE